MDRLRYGTCSWKYPSWEGLVYSAAKGINYLEEYARKYRTVEIDQWFWSLFKEDQVVLPNPFDVENYGDAVSPDFRFTVKVPNSITLTHYYKKSKADPLKPNPHFLSPELFARFWDTLEPIRDRLGSLIFQFEYLNKMKMANQGRFLEQFEQFAACLPPGHEYGVETRNPYYLNKNYFEFLGRNQLSHVFLQGYWMPPIAEVHEKWRSYLVKQKSAVIRLHGPDRQDMEKRTGKLWNKIVEPRDEELKAVAAMLRDLVNEEVDAYLNVNNHYEGSAPLTIERIEELYGTPDARSDPPV